MIQKGEVILILGIAIKTFKMISIDISLIKCYNVSYKDILSFVF